MGFADKYFQRFNCNSIIFNDNPRSNMGIIVVIPCYDDEFIFNTLDSLEDSNTPNSNVEVIVVVNSSEDTPENIRTKNRTIYNQLLVNSDNSYYKNFKLLAFLVENVSKKQAGVGNARKIGMDEALRRFNYLNKSDGAIVSLDADTLVDENYFVEIESHLNIDKIGLVILQFKHDFNESLYSEEVIDACQLYEIYLRYFRLSLEWSGFPYSIHTIGSCFAVKASVYAKAGGMSRRQGGEDFYFLHKTVPQTNYVEISNPLVFPSPRMSDRVPFGTGPAVKSIISESQYLVYNFELFALLKQFFKCFESLYIDFENSLLKLPVQIVEYFGLENISKIVEECKNNTSTEAAFVKRMFTKFDAFQIVKFLNSFENSENYPNMDVLVSAKMLIEVTGKTEIEHLEIQSIYSKILDLDCNG